MKQITKDTILKQEIKKLKKNLSIYEKAYGELNCYFDSISDEEQPKVAKRLEKFFNKLI